MSHDDFAFEPIPGLPALLPAGEKLLWQGSPSWKSLAIRAYHVRKVALYFAVLLAWRIGSGMHQGQDAGAIAGSCLMLVVLAAAAIGLLMLLGFLTARATVYSITSRRVLLRHGVAVPLTLNLPLKRIDSADLCSYADGTGDIALTVPARERVGYLITWPHLRAGAITHPQPSLRAVANPQEAATILAGALAAAA